MTALDQQSATLVKKMKLYAIQGTSYGFMSNTYPAAVGTIDELIAYHNYTLDCGDSWQYENGAREVKTNPSSIEALVTSLNNAAYNIHEYTKYKQVEITQEMFDRYVKRHSR